MKKNIREYLKENYTSIHEDSYMKDLYMLDEELEENDVFLLGENHGVKANTELKMIFLKYFKEKINFKYYLSELPYSMTYFLNIYLKNGDEEVLKEAYKVLKGTDAWNKDEYQHWIGLYEYNKGLLEKDRLNIIGIDIEHQPKNAFKFMDYCLRDQEESTIKRYIREYKRKEDISYEELKVFNKKINRELDKNQKLYKDLLKDNYQAFKHVNQNIYNMAEVYSGNNFNGIRDKFMYENFLYLSKSLNSDKYFGQMGLSHIFKSSFPGITWFSKYLNDSPTSFYKKVISIAYAYKDCKYLYPTTRKNYVSTIDTLDEYIGGFEDLIEDKYSLFKLNKVDSPFKKDLIWPLSHKYPEGNATADYFDYLLVIKESQAMKGFFI